MGFKSSDKPKLKHKKGLWSPEEDQRLRNYVLKHGHACWSSVPVNAGLQRNGKSCRLRWINYLETRIKARNVYCTRRRNNLVPPSPVREQVMSKWFPGMALIIITQTLFKIPFTHGYLLNEGAFGGDFHTGFNNGLVDEMFNVSGFKFEDQISGIGFVDSISGDDICSHLNMNNDVMYI
ncbi:hypothetical protein Patl1_20110 [Pistacia atlantica]|uniref:Uncharacterized protein n=1 Tax=Pistacia atlantica TaxID=434234 RepID=A0ACC1BJS8_9ROSI|nr:hypothetical protein Patl1_20110 [Pistacia atlantica]